MSAEFIQIASTHLWQLSLVAIVAWFSVRRFAKNRPHLAHTLWALVLLKCVTPPVFYSPTSPFTWMAACGAANSLAAAPATESREVNQAEPFQPLIVHLNGTSKTQLGQAKPTVGSEPTERASRAVQTLLATAKRYPRDWWLFAWLCSSLATLVVIGIRLAGFLQTIRRTRRSAPATVSAVKDLLVLQLGIRRKVHVTVVDAPIGPAVVGLFRPNILLPAAIVHGKSAKQLEPLIAHELIHIRRGDLGWAAIQALATSLWWFHPLVWIASRCLTREAERSCDEETIACLGCRPTTYARALLDVLEQKHRLRVAPALPGVRPVDITAIRLERIMNMNQGCNRHRPWWMFGLFVISAAIALPGAGFLAAQDEGGQDETQPVITPDNNGVLPNPLSLTNEFSEGDVVLLPSTDQEAHRPRLKSYDVADLLSELHESGMSEADAGAVVVGRLSLRQRRRPGTVTRPHKVRVQFCLEDGSIHMLGGHEPTAKVIGNRLHVLGTPEEHAEVTEGLRQMRQYGLTQQLIVQVHFVTLPQELVEKLGIEWNTSFPTTDPSQSKILLGGSVNSDLGVAGQLFVDATVVESSTYPSPAAAQAAVNKKHAVTPESGRPTQPNAVGNSFPRYRPRTGAASATPVALASHSSGTPAMIIQRTSSQTMALTCILDDDSSKKVLEQVQRHPQSNILAAPRITLFNGQDVTISQETQRPFVVSFTPLKDQHGQETASFQPIIKVISEGIRIDLKPVLTDDATAVQIDCSAQMTRVDRVDTFRFETPSGSHGEQLTIQQPVVREMLLRGSHELLNESTLVLSGLNSEKDGEHALLMITCQKVPSTTAEHAGITKRHADYATVAAGSDEQLQPQNEQLFNTVSESDPVWKNALPLQGNAPIDDDVEQKLSTNNTELHDVSAAPDDRSAANTGRTEFLRELDKRGFSFSCGAAPQVAVNEQTVVVQDSDFSFSPNGTPLMLFTCARGEFKFDRHGPKWSAQLEDVRFFMERTSASADRSTIKGNAIVLKGRVQLVNGDSTIQAERLEMNIESQPIQFSGKATLTRPSVDGPPLRLQIERFEWDTQSNEMSGAATNALNSKHN